MFIKESVKEMALSSIVDTTKCINYPTLANGYGVMQTYVDGKKKTLSYAQSCISIVLW